LSHHGVMNEGYTSTVLGLKGIPREAETIMIARAIQLARLTGARLHIAHLSTRESVDLVRQAKKAKLSVTCEVTPHHFSLTDEALLGYDANFKMNPPLREKRDVDAILEGLKDGTIECIATDHAPHADYEELVEMDYAPFGIVGLETSVSLGLDRLVKTKVLTLSQWVEKMSTSPARLLSLEGLGSLEPGMAGDVTILDLDKEVKIDNEQFESKSKNSPFQGWKLKGGGPNHDCCGERVAAERCFSMKKAYLALEDGTVFDGKSFGAEGEAFGEVVFNTSMMGYQEVLNDPSYKGQIVTMTYPLIGNYGVNLEDYESDSPKVEGFVIRELSRIPSNYRSQSSLDEYLKKTQCDWVGGDRHSSVNASYPNQRGDEVGHFN